MRQSWVKLQLSYFRTLMLLRVLSVVKRFILFFPNCYFVLCETFAILTVTPRAILDKIVNDDEEACFKNWVGCKESALFVRNLTSVTALDCHGSQTWNQLCYDYEILSTGNEIEAQNRQILAK